MTLTPCKVPTIHRDALRSSNALASPARPQRYGDGTGVACTEREVVQNQGLRPTLSNTAYEVPMQSRCGPWPPSAVVIWRSYSTNSTIAPEGHLRSLVRRGGWQLRAQTYRGCICRMFHKQKLMRVIFGPLQTLSLPSGCCWRSPLSRHSLQPQNQVSGELADRRTKLSVEC